MTTTKAQTRLQVAKTTGKTKKLITTAIDYTNDVIHIGHAYQKVLADSIARFYRRKYRDDKVAFVTGTDEHGQKIFNTAKGLNKDVKKLVDEISLADKKEQDSLNISYNRFIRTTDNDHKKEAALFFEKVYKNGYIYKDTYRGLYCEGCEAFKTQKDLVDGRCEFHPNKEIATIEEENYFFKLSSFREFLKNHFNAHPEFVLPRVRFKEMYVLIDNLEDVAITRRKEKLSWGITTPVDPEHVIWVWFDALVNYFTFGKSQSFWDESTDIIHFLGKDNARMHALLWPAMLKAADYLLPTTIYVNAFLSLEGQKISKSFGNVIRPSTLTEKYGVDAVRYYFLRYGPIIEDANFSLKHLEEVYNADLANGLGNCVARIAKLAANSGLEFAVLPLAADLWDQPWAAPLNDFRVDLALHNIWQKIAELDKHINANEPWKITDSIKLHQVLTHEANALREIATILAPFMPQTSDIIKAQFNTPKIQATAPLFPRL